jgi:hypothetical protein
MLLKPAGLSNGSSISNSKIEIVKALLNVVNQTGQGQPERDRQAECRDNHFGTREVPVDGTEFIIRAS